MPRAHIYDTMGLISPPPSLRLVHAFRKNLVRESDAGNPHVRFDDRGRETELRQRHELATQINWV